MTRWETAILSLGVFPDPAKGTIVKPPKELTNEKHLQISLVFFMDFVRFSFSEEEMVMDSAMQVFAFAGIST